MAEINWIKTSCRYVLTTIKSKSFNPCREGDAILVVWIRILALAGKCNAKGLVLIEDEFPYSDEMLATILLSRWQPSAWPPRPSRSST